jgi:hypothetical protein
VCFFLLEKTTAAVAVRLEAEAALFDAFDVFDVFDAFDAFDVFDMFMVEQQERRQRFGWRPKPLYSPRKRRRKGFKPCLKANRMVSTSTLEVHLLLSFRVVIPLLSVTNRVIVIPCGPFVVYALLISFPRIWR